MARFSLRTFFAVFVVVGVFATSMKQSDETWGAISLVATLLALVCLVVQAIYADNTLAFGCVAGFLVYVCVASTAFGAFNPIVHHLQLAKGFNIIGMHLWHLYAAWFCGLLAAPFALLVRSSVTNRRRLGTVWMTLSVLCCLGLAELNVFGWPGWWNGAFALVTLMVSTVTAATTAVFKKDAFGAGYLVGLVGYVGLGTHYFSALNPVDQALSSNQTSLVVTLPITAAWATSLLCGALAYLVHRRICSGETAAT